MSADDYLSQDPNQGFSADLDTNSMSGNRPASGARRATPGEVLSQGFQGDQNAGDFLGLDLEFAGSQDPNALGGSPLDLVQPPGAYVDDGSAAYADVPAPAPLPATDAVQDFTQAPSAFEFGEDLGSDEGASAIQGDAPRSKLPLVLSGLLVAGLAGAGLFFGPDLYSRYFGGSTEVATTAPAAPKAKAPKEGAKAPPPETAKPESGVPVEVAKAPSAPADPVVPESAPPKSEVTTPSGSAPRSAVPGTGTSATAARPTTPPRGDAVPTQVAASPSAPAARPQVQGFPNLGGEAYDWASADQLELIWRGSEVPLEALAAPAKTLMPRVGTVRVFTTSGDVFQGRLYAVGQNRVWLDTQPGRIGLDAERVDHIEVLPPSSDNGQKVASLDDQNLTGSKRVRVRVPGGMLYGRVLKSEGEEVILVPDGGGRVRVRAEDVQELGSARAIVVNR